MNIILTEDVKGKGKKNQVIRLADGYANFLIRGGKALPATDENMKALAAIRTSALEQERSLIEQMQGWKLAIESEPLVIKAKASADGALFGSISTKALSEEYARLHGFTIDKRRITTAIPIQAVGTYTVTIDLVKTVKAEGIVKVEAA